MFSAVNLEQLFWWGSGLSVAALVICVLAVPMVIARLPSDYFSRPVRPDWLHSSRSSATTAVLAIVKNLLGVVLVILGVLMLVTPGQGLLTLLAGLLLMNFPGKYRLERMLVRQPGVLRALNWIRDKRQQAPFEAPGPSDAR